MVDNNVVEIILYIAGGIITLSGALAILIKYFTKKISLVAKEALLGDIKSISDKLDKFVTCYDDEKIKMSKVLMNLAQDRINQAHEYFMKLGSIDSHSMYIVEQLYESYKTLGGNGHAEAQMCNLRQLHAETLEKCRGDYHEQKGNN